MVILSNADTLGDALRMYDEKVLDNWQENGGFGTVLTRSLVIFVTVE